MFGVAMLSVRFLTPAAASSALAFGEVLGVPGGSLVEAVCVAVRKSRLLRTTLTRPRSSLAAKKLRAHELQAGRSSHRVPEQQHLGLLVHGGARPRASDGASSCLV
jgi:hypothetical protein